MAMEAHVFFRGKLPTKAALARALKELRFPLSIKPATGSLEQQSGFMPMTLGREGTGVEFALFDGRAAIAELAGENVALRFDRIASLRWGGDDSEMLAGVCTAAALAKLTSGVVLDEAEGEVLSADDAIGKARENLKASVGLQATRRAGAGAADIKRYLRRSCSNAAISCSSAGF